MKAGTKGIEFDSKREIWLLMELLEEERESGMTDRELEKQQAHLIDYIKALEWVTGDKETL